MQALQLAEPHHWRTIEIVEPPAPGVGEVLLRIHHVGICGTDYGGFLGKMPFFSYPRIPGHELGVEVAALGLGVENVKVGDLCAVEPYLNCGQCYPCRTGHTNCCEENQTLGVHCDGGMQPFFTLPARKLHVANGLTSEQCALVETLAIGCHAVNRGAPKVGEHVLVIGAGPIGLSAIEFARLSGARTFVMDTNTGRLAFVRDRLGVPDTLLAEGNEADFSSLAKATNGRMADVVIDATGNHLSMARALEFASFAGRVVYVGITQQMLSFPHAPVMHRRELTLLASRNALPGDFVRIIDLIRGGEIDTQPWITHRAKLEEVPASFPLWLEPDSGVIKAIVQVA